MQQHPPVNEPPSLCATYSVTTNTSHPVTVHSASKHITKCPTILAASNTAVLCISTGLQTGSWLSRHPLAPTIGPQVVTRAAAAAEQIGLCPNDCTACAGSWIIRLNVACWTVCLAGCLALPLQAVTMFNLRRYSTSLCPWGFTRLCTT